MFDVETIVYLCSNLFRIYVLYRFTMKFFNERSVSFKMIIFGFTAYFIINSCAYVVMPNLTVNIISNILPYLLITFLFKARMVTRIWVSIIVYSISIFVDIVVVSVKSIADIDSVVISGGVATSLLMFMIELLYEYFLAGNDGKKTEINAVEILFIVFVPVGSMIIALRIMNLPNVNYFPEAIILFSINVIVFYMYDELKKGEKQKIDKLMLEQQNELYLNQIRLQNETNEKIRILRHDMKNHIYQMRLLLKGKELNELEEYMNDMLGSVTTETAICNSGNYDVDGIVNAKLSKAKDMNAELHLDVKIPNKLNVDSFDMNRILGNLFDNVLTAIEQVDRKIVYFQMLYSKGVINICIRNTFSGEVKVNEHDRLLSVKKDAKHHGLGLKSVNETVEKYDGEFEYEYEKNVFSIYLMMYEKV